MRKDSTRPFSNSDKPRFRSKRRTAGPVRFGHTRLRISKSLVTLNLGFEQIIADAVRSYIACRLFVLPLHAVMPNGSCTCGRWHRSAGKHPVVRHGIYDARVDSGALLWWRRWPWANIGVNVGASGLVVVDIDPQNGGEETFSALLADNGDLPTTLTARTGSGGRHYIFTDPSRSLRPAKIAPGVDLLGRGSLFVAAPSVHRSLTRYTWLNEDESIAPVPAWLEGCARNLGDQQ